MGCRSSKNSRKVSNISLKSYKTATTLPTILEITGLPSYDEFFQKASSFIYSQGAERASSKDNRTKAIELVVIDKSKEIQFIDITKVLFWSISAANEGKLSASDFIISEDDPFNINLLDPTSLNEQILDLFDHVIKYYRSLEISEECVDKNIKTLDNMVKQAQNMRNNIDESLNNFPQLEKTLQKNLEILENHLANSKTLRNQALEGVKDIDDFIKNHHHLMDDSNEIGAKAFAAGKFLPKEIFENFYNCT